MVVHTSVGGIIHNGVNVYSESAKFCNYVTALGGVKASSEFVAGFYGAVKLADLIDP